MPELSIIVPVYKVEKYLPRCIDSILAQTFRDFELILIDDGSPDNCGAICDDYAARDSRIRVIHQPNAGVSAARNAGLDIATGTYLGFVDSDDWIEPEMYETMIATAREKQVDVVVCGVNYCKEDGTFIRSDLGSEGTYDKEQMLFALYGMPNPLGGMCWNKIIRVKAINNCRFRTDVTMAEDWFYLFECFRDCESGEKVKNARYNFAQRANSATHSEQINTIYEPFVKVKMWSVELAKEVSFQLEAKAVDKYLDDCLRYLPAMCSLAKAIAQPYKLQLLHIKWIMTKLIVNAYVRKLLPIPKIKGYIVGMMRIA